MNSLIDFNDRFLNGRCSPLSEVVVQRRRAVAGWSDSNTTLQQSPLPPTPPEAPPPSTKCSSCSCERARAGAEEQDGLRVEARLYNAELEEAMADERVEAKRDRLRSAAKLLEALDMFSQSTDLKARALARLTQVTGNFTCKEPMTSHALNGILDEIQWDVGALSDSLAKVAGASKAAAKKPDGLYELLEDFRDKKKDFQTVSTTLIEYVRTNKRSSSGKRRKFEAQYDSIREIYQQSREVLEKELSKLIETRQNVVEQCFSKLAPLQETMVEQDRQFLALSKEVAKCLWGPKKLEHRCSSGSKL